MFKSTLTLLKSRLRFLRSYKKKKSTAPVLDVLVEKAPAVVASTPEITVSPPTDDQLEVRYERKMGDTELSYYLPSRANGVNDMYALLSSYADATPELAFCVQVSSSRFQSTNPRHGARESARGLGNPPPATPIARSDCGDARLRRRPICVRDPKMLIGYTWADTASPPPLRYRPDASAQGAVESADANLEYRTETKDRESIHILTGPYL